MKVAQNVIFISHINADLRDSAMKSTKQQGNKVTQPADISQPLTGHHRAGRNGA